ncbi:MAG: hypothetical protein CXT79_02950 [Thaumarchaeota archaeon]|nr:MAG: hypothetical protein CXT79_02950 [Nitrososphaerota archaeon]
MQKRIASYCDTTLCFQNGDFIHSWSKFEGRLDMNSSTKLFFDITPGKKVIFSTAICDDGAETASQVERLKKAVQFYNDMADMKLKANYVKSQAGNPKILGPDGKEISNPVFEQKMELYNTMCNISSMDDINAALQLTKLIKSNM